MRAENIITIRQAGEPDLDQVLALSHEFHEFHVHGVPDRLRVPAPYDDATVRDLLVHILRNEDAALLVAYEGERMVGFAEVYLRRDTPHPAAIDYVYGYLQSLVVTEPLRKRGLGRRLVAAAEQWSRERGATEMRLTCWEFDGGPIPFYEALGYQTMKRIMVRPLR